MKPGAVLIALLLVTCGGEECRSFEKLDFLIPNSVFRSTFRFGGCGATAISHRAAVTARHCVARINPAYSYVSPSDDPQFKGITLLGVETTDSEWWDAWEPGSNKIRVEVIQDDVAVLVFADNTFTDYVDLTATEQFVGVSFPPALPALFVGYGGGSKHYGVNDVWLTSSGNLVSFSPPYCGEAFIRPGDSGGMLYAVLGYEECPKASGLECVGTQPLTNLELVPLGITSALRDHSSGTTSFFAPLFDPEVWSLLQDYI